MHSLIVIVFVKDVSVYIFVQMKVTNWSPYFMRLRKRRGLIILLWGVCEVEYQIYKHKTTKGYLSISRHCLHLMNKQKGRQ